MISKPKKIGILAVLVVLLSATVIVQPVNAMEYNEQEMKIDINPYYENDANNPMDLTMPLNNQTSSRNNYAKWNDDFLAKNQVPPQGSYVGSHFTPSQFQLDYDPMWQSKLSVKKNVEPQNYDELSVFVEQPCSKYNKYSQVGKYGLTIISLTRSFTSNQIMNGASEFWVKMPIDGNGLVSIPLDSNIYASYTGKKEVTAHSQIFPGFYIYQGSHKSFHINGSNSMGIFDLRADESIPSIANSIITPEDNYDGAVYQKVNCILKPNIPYTFSFLAITNKQPVIKVNDQTTDDASVIPTLIDIEDLKVECYWKNLTNNDHKIFTPSGLFAQVTILNQEPVEFPLEPHFSFMFTAGVGMENLFGYKLRKESRVTISRSHEFGGERENMTYPSIYTPFKYEGLEPGIRPNVFMRIADDNSKQFGRVNITVPNMISNATSEIYGIHDYVPPISVNRTMDYFRNASGSKIGMTPSDPNYNTSTTGYYGWQRMDYNPYKYNYSRYFLASGPRIEYYATNSVDWPGGVGKGMNPYSGDGYIQIGFDFPGNTTLLCRSPKNSIYKKYPTNTYSFRPYSWGIANDIQDYDKNYTPLQYVFIEHLYKVSTHWMGERFRIQDPSNSIMEANFGGTGPYEVWWNFTDAPERFFYDVHTSVKFPSTRWNTLKMPMGVKYMDSSLAKRYGVGHRQIVHGEHRDYLMILTKEVTTQDVKEVDKKVHWYTLGLTAEKEVKHKKTVELQTEEGSVLDQKSIVETTEYGGALTWGAGAGGMKISEGLLTGLGYHWEELSTEGFKYHWSANLRHTIYKKDQSITAGFTETSQYFRDSQTSMTNRIISYITSIPSKIWQLLQNLGKWIMRNVLKMVAPIINILQDLWHIGGLYLQALGYAFSFLFLFLMLFLVAKVMNSGVMASIRRQIR